jgi:toxin ParE1/3/4
MMGGFRLSTRAETDVAEIRSYISQENSSAADQFVGELFDLFQLLGRNPKIGQLRPELRPNLCSFSHGNYVVFYCHADERAEIVAVVHGARDVEGMFQRGER